MRIALLILLGFVILSACKPQDNLPKVNAECLSDADCGVGGCSGQVCATKEKAENIITTCDFRPEYACLELTNCICQNGKCNWEQNQEYIICLEKSE
ncbi:eight-cysteine-cluster domain-containing protein [Candidatus Woesearchaeota archaeon]|nr:eight-cysteine-cluster domain-containing protein [Candidatus Woesearchaeota archaeon]